jgi:hypothetical protein
MTLLDELRIIVPMGLALASSYAYGTLFARRAGAATRCLIGISILALVVGILANVAANLISIFLQVAVVAGIVLSAFVIAEEARRWRFSKSTVSPLIAALLIGGAVFVLNSPSRYFLGVDTTTGDLYLKFNPHYSYFSSLSSEMAAADYLGRLRIQNQWPLEWSAYHFFASAVTAAIQTFGEHDLVGYFYAQLVILIALVLSLRELLVGRPDTLRRNLVFVAWLITGMSLFEGALRWLLYSNSAISLWATIAFLVLLFDGRRRETFVVILILGLSSTRLVPIAAAVMLLTIVFDRSGRRLYKRMLVDPRVVVLYAAGISYLGLTFFAAPTPPWAKFFNKGALDATWHHLLALYRATGFALNEMAHKPLPNYAHGGNYLDFFAHAKTLLPSGTLLGAAILLAATATFIAAIRKVYHCQMDLLGSRPWGRILIAGILALIVLRYLTKLHGMPLFGFFFIFLWYIACTVLLAEKLANRKFLLILAGSMFAAMIYLLTGSNSIKGPVSYSMFEVPLWAVIGLLMQRQALPPSAYIVVAMLWLAFPPHIRAVGLMDGSPVVALPKGGILDRRAIAAAFERRSERGACDAAIDAYAALLGRRMDVGDVTKCFITRDFAIPTD